jgi:Asp-tRNA(Asn)/Glu-tRNA(Gln) amidotransferase A subunit family amidase/ketopantoate reductase
VLFCDTDEEHVAAIEEHGLRLEGPVEEVVVEARAVVPEALPDQLQAVLLAVKSQHTAAALEAVAPRLAPDGFVVSLQNGINEPLIASVVGAERTVGAFVNFGADYLAPGRIFLAGRGALYVGELDGRRTDRLERLLADLPSAKETANILGFLWAKEAYGAMLFATAVSDLSIVDALSEPRYRIVFTQLAREVLDAAPVPVEAFDGFDADDLDGSIERLVEFNRRSAKTHSGIYRDLMVRRRPTEKAMLAEIDGPLLRRTLELIGEIEEGRRTCEVANLELLAAYARLHEQGALNAVVTELPPGPRAPGGPLLGSAVAVKDNVDVAGVVTSNASTVGTPPPAPADAPIVARLRNAAADLLCKTNLLEYAAGSVNPAYGMTRNPRDPSRTSGGSSSGSTALVAAGVVDHAIGTDTGGSIRIPAAYCGIVGLKPSAGLVPLDGVFPLSPSCDNVGPLTRTAAQAGVLLGVLAAQPVELRPVERLRVGVLRRQLDDPDLTDGVRARVGEALELLAGLGWELVETDLPELDEVDRILGNVVLHEAWHVHRHLYEREADGYGPGTRALLELGSRIDEDTYREALDGKRRVAAAFARLFETVDVLAGPTVAYVAPPEDPPFGTSEGDVEGRYTSPYNLSGSPAVSVPCGIAEGTLPAGLQLAAAVGADALLLSAAHAYEEAAQ